MRTNMENAPLCSCGPKIWTRIIASIQLMMCITIVAAVANLAIAVGPISDLHGLDPHIDAYYTIYTVVSVLSAVMALLSLLLLIGNEMGKPLLMCPMLIIEWIGIVVGAGAAVVFMFLGPVEASMVPEAAAALIPMAFSIYVIHKRLQELSTTRQGPMPGADAQL